MMLKLLAFGLEVKVLLTFVNLKKSIYLVVQSEVYCVSFSFFII
jgi:hypothetical protein